MPRSKCAVFHLASVLVVKLYYVRLSGKCDGLYVCPKAAVHMYLLFKAILCCR